jgi:hypothetical protein
MDSFYGQRKTHNHSFIEYSKKQIRTVRQPNTALVNKINNFSAFKEVNMKNKFWHKRFKPDE